MKMVLLMRGIGLVREEKQRYLKQRKQRCEKQSMKNEDVNIKMWKDVKTKIRNVK
jgi:hypothetical protein